MKHLNSGIIHIKQRSFKESTHDEIEKSIIKKAIKSTKNQEHFLESAIANLLIIDEQDIGFTLGCKYVNCKERAGTLIGKCQIKNFKFIGAEVTGTFDIHPVFIIFYMSKQGLREYVPIVGNCINLDWNSALGAEGMYYTELAKKDTEENLIKKYKKRRIHNPNKTWAEMYCDKYKINISAITFDWDSIQEDIMIKFNL